MNGLGPWLPHDLLWGMTPAQLAADAPDWAFAVLEAGQPVVVRRALTAPGQIAVGLRGRTREQRYPAVLALESVQRGVHPEALCRMSGSRSLPALRALQQLRGELDALGLVWGVSGSAGFELACGIAALHQHSDLDLILRTPEPFSRTQARELLALLECAECLVDLQLQVPAGALALREWAGTAPRVLLKSAGGARLVSDPWCALEQAA
ncbi:MULTISPECIES: malonate decarboxylase holo-ACP synthase [Pseudomonas]|uniref:malonate decarboxylase holo-ACP synthase n=1 Tax=Pseudomonas TaxID=286 RepID=UPI001BCB1D8F|nr:malonate decarboxylase holo-ACP synthase [Pseudomonas protegens]MBS7559564.1 malonate decarboxylase holo-ACP synthase [Pseudomonas sp. RC4D1]MDP9516270.1 malonate decarboxylase holo-ACP synthase [Pseudomonas protegens]